jgi:hypothetical protein
MSKAREIIESLNTGESLYHKRYVNEGVSDLGQIANAQNKNFVDYKNELYDYFAKIFKSHRNKGKYLGFVYNPDKTISVIGEKGIIGYKVHINKALNGGKPNKYLELMREVSIYKK